MGRTPDFRQYRKHRIYDGDIRMGIICSEHRPRLPNYQVGYSMPRFVRHIAPESGIYCANCRSYGPTEDSPNPHIADPSQCDYEGGSQSIILRLSLHLDWGWSSSVTLLYHTSPNFS